MFVVQAWGNTGGIFFVPTSRITDVITDDKTMGGLQLASYATGSRSATAAWWACQYHNKTGIAYIETGYDSTRQKGDYYIKKIYGIKIK